MAHKGLDERVIIEVARTCGLDTGYAKHSYRKLQQDLVLFKGCSLGELEEFALDFDYQKRISNSQAAGLYRRHGWPKDRLRPLQNFLLSRVGTSWGKTISHLRSVIKGRGDSVRHVLSHVDQFVEEHPVFIDGQVCKNPGKGWGGLRPLPHWCFYVDDEGLLQQCPQSVRIDAPERYGDPTMCYRHDRWYLLCTDDRVQYPWGRYEGLKIGTWYELVEVPSRRYKSQLVCDENGSPCFEYWGDALVEKVPVEFTETHLVEASAAAVASILEVMEPNPNPKPAYLNVSARSVR